MAPKLDIPTLGDPQVDDEHRHLGGLLSKAIMEYRRGKPDAGLTAFRTFLDAALCHFAAEEALMQQAAYPGLPEHLDAHRRFSSDAAEMVAAAARGSAAPAAVALWLDSRVVSWWNLHIRGADAHVARYLDRRAAEDHAVPASAAQPAAQPAAQAAAQAPGAQAAAPGTRPA